jgi:hypothetical protein
MSRSAQQPGEASDDEYDVPEVFTIRRADVAFDGAMEAAAAASADAASTSAASPTPASASASVVSAVAPAAAAAVRPAVSGAAFGVGPDAQCGPVVADIPSRYKYVHNTALDKEIARTSGLVFSVPQDGVVRLAPGWRWWEEARGLVTFSKDRLAPRLPSQNSSTSRSNSASAGAWSNARCA